MRAKEFIKEGTMHDWHKQGIPGMKSLDGIGQYYDIYRFGLAMAAAGNPKDPILGEPDGVTEDNPTTLSYTQADEDIINAGLKRIGKTAKQITPRISAEPTDTNVQSPVQPKGPVRRKN
jgi:hypothetical protein